MILLDKRHCKVFPAYHTFLGFLFRPQTEFFFKWPKKIKSFGDNVRKYRVMNAVQASLNAIMEQMAETS